MKEIKTGDIVEIKLPKLGESITEATIINWLVKKGDTVAAGQEILEVATDKVNSEIPSPYNGVISDFRVKANDVVKIGEVIAQIQVSDKVKVKEEKQQKKEAIPKPGPAVPKVDIRKRQPQIQASGSSQTYVLPGRNDNSFYSPLVREIAVKHHISYEELARIPATGQDGRLRKSDIFKYLEEGRPAQFVQTMPMAQPSGFQIPDLKFDKGQGEIVEMDRMAQMISDHMIFSKIASPHVTAYVEVDMTKMWDWRKKNKDEFEKKYGERLTFTPLFVEAVAKAIQDFPKINSTRDGNKIIIKPDINVGIGAALPTGNIIVPVVKNADKKDLKELAADVNLLVERARTAKLKADDTQGGTFTLSNVGTFGSLMGTPVINQPQAAILATGVIKKRAVVIETKDGDEIVARPMMYLCLSFDHSYIDGHLAGSFLKRVGEYFVQFDNKRKI